MSSIKQLSLILFLGLISASIEATTLNFNYANKTTQVIAGVKVTQTESDGVITIFSSNSNGEVTLPSTSNTYTLSASLAETGDDPISLIDAIQILQYSGELRELTADQKTAADVNKDGEVDVLDAIWILQHLGELRTLDGGLIFLDANTGKPLSETTFNPGDTPSISVIRLGDVDGDFDPISINNSDSNGGSTDNDTDDNDIVDAPDNEDTPMDSDLPDLSFWTNDYDLSFITLPDTVVEAPIVLTDALLELIEIPSESLELIFPLNGDAIHMDKVANSAVNEINLDPLLQNDWQAVIEEYIYTSELG